MATKFYKRPKAHHFNSDGTPRFKYTTDPVTGKKTIDPDDEKYLDFEIVSEEVPDPPAKKVANFFWTILKGILFIFAYGAARGHIHEKQKRK